MQQQILCKKSDKIPENVESLFEQIIQNQWLGFNYNNLGLPAPFHITISQLNYFDHLKMELDWRHIDDEGVTSLSQILAHLNLYELKLELDCSNATQKGIKSLYSALSKLSSLSSLQLQLSCNNICDQGAKYLSKALSKLIYLESLSLKLNWNVADKSGVILIDKTLSKLQNLKSLTLLYDNQKIDSQQDPEISSLNSKCLRTTSHIPDQVNLIQQDEAVQLISSEELPLFTTEDLSLLQNLKKLKLQVDSNHKEDTNIFEIPQSLSSLFELSSQLLEQKLICSWAWFDSIPLPQIFNQLINLTHLELLLDSTEFGLNKIGEIGAQQLSSINKLFNITSLQIKLAHNRIGYQGATLLLQAIGQLLNLNSLQLDLNKNMIGEEGVKSISALINLQRLTTLELELSSNQILQSGAKSLSKVLRQLINLKFLSVKLNNNFIGNEGASSLSLALRNLKNLNSLNLQLDNHSIEYGPILITSALFNLRNLTMLQLNFDICLKYTKLDPIYDGVNQKISSVISQNQNLTFLLLKLNMNSFEKQEASKLFFEICNLKNLTSLSLNLYFSCFFQDEIIFVPLKLSKLSKLECLELYIEDRILSESEIASFSSELKNLKNLVCLKLEFCKCTCGFQAFYLALSQLTNLSTLKFIQKLHFPQMDLSISNALMHLKNLSSLELNCNLCCIRGERIIPFPSALGQLRKLITLKLNLTTSNICKRCVGSLSSALIQLPNLESLTLLCSKDLDDLLISEGLSQLINLKYLELDLNLPTIEVIDISSALRQLIHLTSLRLRFQKQLVTQEIENVFDTLARLKNITFLDLSFSSYSIRGTVLITSCLSQLINLSSLRLKLEFPNTESLELHELFSALRQLKNLSSFEFLSIVPQKYNQAINSLQYYLMTPLNLRHLHLELSSYMTDKEIIFFSQSLSKSLILESLYLDLNDNLILINGAKSLFSALGLLAKLQSLYLRISNNKIRDEGIQYLSSSLINLKNLTTLELDIKNIKISIESDKQLVAVIMRIPFINFKSIWSNFKKPKNDDKYQKNWFNNKLN